MPQNNQTLLEKTVADQWQTLPSGLTVLVRPMPGYSSTHVIYATKFGSIDRDFCLNGQTVHLPAGVAHFLEHKMFEDEDGDAFAKYAKTGANANAFTSFDRTCYLFTATQQLDESLDVLLGMVGHPYFTEQTIAKEQGIIGQEIKMYDDSPDWRLITGLFECLYHSHPIRSDIAGTVESIADAFTQYFYLFTLGSASLSIVAGIPGTITGFLAYTFIPALERRWTSKQIVIRAVIVKAVVSSAIFLIGAHWYRDPRVIVPLMMVWGVFNSAVSSIKMVIPTKMIGDTVDYMEWKTKERSEGTSFSLLTFVSKLTGSLATAVSAALIPVIGLQQVNQDMVLPEGGELNTRFLLWAIVTIIPAVLNLLSLIPFIFYDLEGEKLDTIHRELAQRRENLTGAAADAE